MSRRRGFKQRSELLAVAQLLSGSLLVVGFGLTFFYSLGFSEGWTPAGLVVLILRLAAAASAVLTAAIAILRNYSWPYWSTSSLACAATITVLTLLIQGYLIVQGIITLDGYSLAWVAIAWGVIIIYDAVALALFRLRNATGISSSQSSIDFIQ